MFSLTLKIVMHLASVAVLTATATAQYTLVHDDGIEIEVSPLLGEPNYGPNTDDDDVINHNYTGDGLDGRESRGDASDDTQSPSVGEVNMTVSDSFSFYVLSEGETSIQGMVKVTGECRARLEDAIGIAAAIAYGSSHIAYGDQEKEAEDDAEIAIGAGNPNHIGVTISGFGFETNTVQATGATQSALLEDLSTGLPEPADAATVDFVRKGHGLWDIEKGLVEVGWEVQTMAKLTVTSAEPAE